MKQESPSIFDDDLHFNDLAAHQTDMSFTGLDGVLGGEIDFE